AKSVPEARCFSRFLSCVHVAEAKATFFLGKLVFHAWYFASCFQSSLIVGCLATETTLILRCNFFPSRDRAASILTRAYRLSLKRLTESLTAACRCSSEFLIRRSLKFSTLDIGILSFECADR